MLSVEVHDQASGLRRLFNQAPAFRACGLFGPDAALRAAAATSLAFALGRRGKAVLILDEADAPRNVASQLGLVPRYRLSDVLQGRCSLDEAMISAPAGVRLLVVGRGLSALAETAPETWAWFVEALHALDQAPEWVIVNTPTLQSQPTLAGGCPNRLLVVPDRRAVLTEAYAVLKGVHQRYPEGRWRVLTMNNRIASRGDESVYSALANTAEHFLGLRMEWFGAVPKDDKLEDSARVMRPLFEVSPGCPAAVAFKDLAEVASGWPHEGETDARTFWHRLYLLGRLATEAAVGEKRNERLGRKYG